MADGSISIDEGVVKARHMHPNADLPSTVLAQRANSVIGVPIHFWRQSTAMGTLISSAASSDLGITSGTYGSAPPYITSGDLKAAGSTTRRARAIFTLPTNYEAAETVTIRVYAGMVTTVADTAATVDIECWRLDKDGTLGASDLCGTAAQSINSLTVASKDFSISASTLTPGDQLDVRLSVLVNDAATLTAVIGAVWQVELLADLR